MEGLMFTGLVEEIGRVSRCDSVSSLRLLIQADRVLEGTKIRDSILVNGVCLTVVGRKGSSFTVEVISQTISKTNLRDLRVGDRVNLERSLSLASRLGGHLVTGDIDGLGRIEQIRQEPDERRVWIRPPLHLMKYIVSQGRVTLEGVSLTVAEQREDIFAVCLIPFTLNNTTIKEKREGGLLNLEIDLIARYVEGLLTGENISSGKINEQFLRKAGF